MVTEVRCLLAERLRQDITALALCRGARAAFAVIHALISQAQRRLGVSGLCRHVHDTVGAADREAVADLDQCCDRALNPVVNASLAAVDQYAELVAPHAIGATAVGDAFLKVGAQAREQRIAGWMAEGVVVELETVE